MELQQTLNLKNTSIQDYKLRHHKKFKNQLVNIDEATEGIKGWELKTFISEGKRLHWQTNTSGGLYEATALAPLFYT